jgi:K+-sensing histidine kinase KdpD
VSVAAEELGSAWRFAREAVRLHDGTITAQNRESGGLQVTITLPLGPRIPAREEDLQHSINEA